jgi:DNA-binding NarL/FixJ family response regulator
MASSPSRRARLSVYLVEPHPLAAQSLRAILSEKNKVRRLAEGEILLNSDLSGVPNSVLVVDKGTLTTPLHRLVDVLKSRWHDFRAIVLDHSCMPEEQFRLLSLGIRGIVCYQDVSRRLQAAIDSVGRGRLWVEPAVLAQYVSYCSRNFRVPGNRDVLTYRECQVLDLARQKLSNKEIGISLLISESTVKFHLANIFSKLGVHDREEAIDIAKPTCIPASPQLVRSQAEGKTPELPRPPASASMV